LAQDQERGSAYGVILAARASSSMGHAVPVDRLLGTFGSLAVGAASYLALRHPRLLFLRTKSLQGRPTQEQLEAAKTTDVVVVRIFGLGLGLAALWFAVIAITG
jgi:hypothetical protein